MGIEYVNKRTNGSEKSQNIATSRLLGKMIAQINICQNCFGVLMLLRMKRSVVLTLAILPCALSAQETVATDEAVICETIIDMPLMHVFGSSTANDTPSVGFATAVTALRFMPTVDVQSRGFAETQCDVVIRGGIFENTGFKVGAITLSDPQTGHYFSEIPIDPMLISSPVILTGVDNAVNGFNSTVGTVAYTWTPVVDGGTLEVGAGTDALFFSRLVAGVKSADNYFLGRSVAFQATSAYSQGDGTVANGDHEFQRFGARIQLAGQEGQTDLYFGYQKKDYGWPGMYTGNAAYDEGDNYEVAILMFNHTQEYGEESHWSVGAYGRQFLDDYELKRSVPGYYRPYEHNTYVSGTAVEGEHNFGGGWKLDWRTEAAADSIESTDLTYANFMSRSYWKSAAELGKQFSLGDGDILIQGGATYDDTNRDGDDATSPLARITYSRAVNNGLLSVYTEFSRATQVSGYTAIGSKPGLASFAGNADLTRETADNSEIGASWERGSFKVGGSFFYRQHIDLVDWTYDSTQPKTFRSASEMDMAVRGFETYAVWEATKRLNISVGYAYLDDNPYYQTANIDASFYAMNYPQHRGTTSVVWKFMDTLELRVDGEARKQEENVRRTSGNDALFADASLGWTPSFIKGLTIALLADNISDCDYEDFPGSPAAGRQAALRMSYVW